jgi:hypothetical protein
MAVASGHSNSPMGPRFPRFPVPGSNGSNGSRFQRFPVPGSPGSRFPRFPLPYGRTRYCSFRKNCRSVRSNPYGSSNAL